MSGADKRQFPRPEANPSRRPEANSSRRPEANPCYK